MVSRTLAQALFKAAHGLRPASKPLRSAAGPVARPTFFARSLVALSLGVSAFAASRYSEELSSFRDLLLPRSIQLDSGPKPDPTPRTSKDAFRIDPDTSTPHPLSLTLGTTDLSLVGLGVRKVSFLRVKVYSAAFYAEDRVMQRLLDVEGWHSYTAQHLLTPPTGTSPQLTGEALMRTFLDRTACAIRIVPVRNTDFSHLRDGFTRALLQRQKLARSRGELAPADDEVLGRSIQLFKALFPSGSVPKGKSLLLVRRNDSIEVQYEGSVLGAVSDKWIARELFMAYFADKDVISDKLKEDVARGLEEQSRR